MGIGAIAKPALMDLAKEGMEDFGSKYAKIITSAEGEGMKSEAGKWIIDTAQKYLTAVKRDAATFSQGRIQQLPDKPWYQAHTAAERAIAKQNQIEMDSAHKMAVFMNKPVHWGQNNERLSQALELAAKEKNIVHATNMADAMSVLFREPAPHVQGYDKITRAPINWRTKGGIKTDSPFVGPTEIESNIRNFLGLTYLGRVVIPHTMQHINSMLSSGVTAYAKGWSKIISKNTREDAVDFAIKSGSMFEETLRDWKAIAEGKDTMWNKVFHMPGFSNVRKWEIIHAANVGSFLHSIMQSSS